MNVSGQDVHCVQVPQKHLNILFGDFASLSAHRAINYRLSLPYLTCIFVP